MRKNRLFLPIFLSVAACGTGAKSLARHGAGPAPQGASLVDPPATQEASRAIYILNAKGICSDCASAIQQMLAAGGRPSQVVSAAEIPTTVRSGIDVVVVPGGENYDQTMRALKRAGADTFITDHVNAGGIYIGHCLGADMAPLLHIFPGTTTDPAPDKDPLAVATVWANSKSERVMYFEDGPRFYPTEPVTVLATFGDSASGTTAGTAQTGIPAGDPAAITYAWGDGRVGLISPHPEANAIWMAELGDEAPSGLAYDLGLGFYDQVLGPVER